MTSQSVPTPQAPEEAERQADNDPKPLFGFDLVGDVDQNEAVPVERSDVR